MWSALALRTQGPFISPTRSKRGRCRWDGAASIARRSSTSTYLFCALIAAAGSPRTFRAGSVPGRGRESTGDVCDAFEQNLAGVPSSVGAGGMFAHRTTGITRCIHTLRGPHSNFCSNSSQTATGPFCPGHHSSSAESPRLAAADIRSAKRSRGGENTSARCLRHISPTAALRRVVVIHALGLEAPARSRL